VYNNLRPLNSPKHYLCIIIIIRPPDIHVDGLMFYHPFTHSFFFLSFFFRQLPSELAERNSTKTGHMLGSNCGLKVHVGSLGYPTPTNRKPQNHLFQRLRKLTATLTAYIFGMKRDIANRASALTTTWGLLRILKMSWTLVHKRLKTRRAFLPTLRKFSIVIRCRFADGDQQTELSQTLPSGGQ